MLRRWPSLCIYRLKRTLGGRSPNPPRARQPASQTMALFEETALELTLQFGLCLQNLFAISTVCRHWRDVVCRPICWLGKLIEIAAANLGREQLDRWLCQWRLAKCVNMSLSQTDLLAAPPSAPYAIAHAWDTEVLSHRNPLGMWRDIAIDAQPWLVCLTADRVPDSVRVMQRGGHGLDCEFKQAVWLGWTSATFADEFGAMSTRIATGRPRCSDIIIGVRLWPRDAWARRGITSMLRGRRLPRAPPPCFTEDTPLMADLHLDRARGAMRIETSANTERLLLSVGHRQFVGRLKFFMAMPVGQGSRRRGAMAAPRPYLTPSAGREAGLIFSSEGA